MAELELRDELIRFLEWEIIGPGEDEEVLEESPTRRYSAGILFPGGNLIDENEDAEADEEAGNEEHNDTLDVPPSEEEREREAGERRVRRSSPEGVDGAYDEPVHLANASAPAAIGLSFLAAPSDGILQFSFEAAAYVEIAGKQKTWKRQCITIPKQSVDVRPDGDRTSVRRNIELCPGLRLFVLSRVRSDGSFLVTAAVYNANRCTSQRQKAKVADCFFQVGFAVEAPDQSAVFREYQLIHSHDLVDSEQRSLELLYRNRRAFAVGHGCAAEWQGNTDDKATLVRTAVVPSVEVPPVLPRADGTVPYRMYHLSGAGGACDASAIIRSLQAVPDAYNNWIATQQGALAVLDLSLQQVGTDHLAGCAACCKRIESGIKCLEEDPNLMKAFMWANQVMLMQQVHYARDRRGASDSWKDLPTSYEPDGPRRGRWRCFQLAFILMNLPALVSDGSRGQSDPRNVVDLIWFPTGGGKTEAYLGLAACSILYRRLCDPTSDGCCVLTRYTLRLLTSQQFQRAASMICACEMLRRGDSSSLGESPISIGLWLGGSSSPNTRSDSKTRMTQWLREKGENPYQLIGCPWCGTALDDSRNPGYRQRSASDSMRFVCPERRCPFSRRDGALPVSVVDEDIYDNPPTMIVATVDKFAMLAWKPITGSILGLGSKKRAAPDLIIQDELHLISGPLGSMVGLYESIIDLMCARGSRMPKIVASTATIRRAEQQCRSLYNRETQVFPPPGIDVSDNYFAFEAPDEPARKYVGVFGSAAPSQITASLRAAAAILQAIRTADVSGESDRDPYWTLVWYFNSIRELGHASTLVEADIPEYLRVIARRLKLPSDEQRRLGRPVELTGRVRADEIPETLRRLEMRHTEANPAIDVLLATNMISVGVDVPRLGLMLVAGQPKTTAEYIQASSRVGRSKEAPGLVVTLYAPGKPRDRSHYEHFRAYHESFYRFVEPTSVTPFSLPAMDRALHALLTIAARHLDELDRPEDFAPNTPALQGLESWLIDRCDSIDGEHSQELRDRLSKLATSWQDHGPEAWGLPYGAPSDEQVTLLYPMGAVLPENASAMWPTPTSLRNVDVECQGQVVQTLGGADENAADEHSPLEETNDG